MATKQERSTLLPGVAAGVGLGGGLQGDLDDIRARGYWEQAWRRFRRDRIALVSGIVIILIVLMAFVGAPVAARVLGHGPNDINSNAVINYAPAGPFMSVKDANGKSTYYVLGASDAVGRDEFLRILSGARVSLEAAVSGDDARPVRRRGAGYAGRLLRRSHRHRRLADDRDRDGVPAAAVRNRDRGDGRATGSTPTRCSGYSCPGIVTLIIIISVFSWYYPARIVRAQVLSLREKEFVEAARMVGGSNFRIMRSHLLPHLVGTIIVYGTLTVATNILFEAALSYLGVGLPPPNASWGNLLSDAVTYYTVQPWLIVWPGVAILITTLSFNLLGDGLRDAIDPRSTL